MTRNIEIVYIINMSKEDGRSFGEGLKERGRTVLKCVALPAIQVTAAIGVVVGATDIMVNPGNKKDIDGQINARVSQAYPRTLSKEQYKLAHREIVNFDKDFTRSPHQFIDRNTLSIKIPENVAQDIDLIAQENTRSKGASALKTQLKGEYIVDEDASKRGSLILGLSSLILLLPGMGRMGVSIFRKSRDVPISPKTANS